MSGRLFDLRCERDCGVTVPENCVGRGCMVDRGGQEEVRDEWEEVEVK